MMLMIRQMRRMSSAAINRMFQRFSVSTLQKSTWRSALTTVSRKRDSNYCTQSLQKSVSDSRAEYQQCCRVLGILFVSVINFYCHFSVLNENGSQDMSDVTAAVTAAAPLFGQIGRNFYQFEYFDFHGHSPTWRTKARTLYLLPRGYSTLGCAVFRACCRWPMAMLTQRTTHKRLQCLQIYNNYCVKRNKKIIVSQLCQNVTVTYIKKSSRDRL